MTSERLPDRFWERIEDVAGCWMWRGALFKGSGYAAMSVNGITKRGHRLTYQVFVGPIPEGLQIDHLCRNRACVNPDHLEAVTAKENCQRARPWHPRGRQTHCKRGHAFTPANTRIKVRGEYRMRECRTCSNQLRKAARAA